MTKVNPNKLPLLKKLFQVQKEITAIVKDKTNPHFKSSYADINKVIEHLKPLLDKNELLLLQPIVDSKVFSEIYDISTGESINSWIDIPDGLAPQKLGSAVTYYRRYTLQSLLGLNAEDDDGNGTGDGNQPKKVEPIWMTEDQFNSTMKCDEVKKVQGAIKTFSTDTQKMKKEWREKLDEHLKSLQEKESTQTQKKEE